MRKIILGLFIILFCFSIGNAELQEEELSKEEKAILKKAIELIKKYKERELLEHKEWYLGHVDGLRALKFYYERRYRKK